MATSSRELPEAEESARVYRVADTLVRVTASETLIAALDAVFLRVLHRGGSEFPVLELNVRSSDERHVVDGTGVARRILPGRAPVGAVALDVASAVAEFAAGSSRRTAHVASVVERDGAAVALVSPQRGDRTALALQMVDRGWRLISDDFAFVDLESRHVAAFPKLLDISARATAALPRAFRPCCETSPWFSTPDRSDVRFFAVDPARAYGDAVWSPGARLRAFVFLDRRDRDKAIEVAVVPSSMAGVVARTLRYEAASAAADAMERWI